MAYNIIFAKGSFQSYKQLSTKDPCTLYFITDPENPMFFLGETKLSSISEVSQLFGLYETQDQSIEAIKSALSGISLTDKGSVMNVISNLTGDIWDTIGEVSALSTTTKTLVPAINELRSNVVQNKLDATMTIEVSEANSTILKSYIFRQGGTPIGEINIPKDLVVKSGKIVEIVEDDQLLGKFVIKGAEVENQYVPVDAPGTYIQLLIANQNEEAPIYINVTKLIDIYTAAPNAQRVQLAVVGTEISGDIVPESITKEELAPDSVITVKIADYNVTYQKLEINLQSAIDKANSAVQTIAEGITDYSILVDNTPVRVHGLGSAALKDDDYFDLRGSAAAVLGTQADSYEALTVFGAHAHARRVEEVCKQYVDDALTWRSIGYTEENEQEPLSSEETQSTTPDNNDDSLNNNLSSDSNDDNSNLGG